MKTLVQHVSVIPNPHMITMKGIPKYAEELCRSLFESVEERPQGSGFFAFLGVYDQDVGIKATVWFTKGEEDAAWDFLRSLARDRCVTHYAVAQPTKIKEEGPGGPERVFVAFVGSPSKPGGFLTGAHSFKEMTGPYEVSGKMTELLRVYH